MNIKVRKMSYEDVLKLPRLQHKKPLKPSRFLATVVRLVSAVTLHNIRFSYTTERMELVGIYDIKPERCALAKENGIHVFTSREELLADERIDFVVVATPNDVHREIAIDAMEHGKCVMSEKPVTMSSEMLEEMIAASSSFVLLVSPHSLKI